MDVPYLPSVPSVIKLTKIAEVVEDFNTKWGKYADKNTRQKLIAFIDWAQLYLQIIDKVQKEYQQFTYKNYESQDIMEENLLKTKLEVLETGAKIIGGLAQSFRESVIVNEDYRKAYAFLLSKLLGCTDTYNDTNYKEFVLGELNSLEYQAKSIFSKNVVAVMDNYNRNSTRQISREYLKKLQNIRKTFDEHCLKFYKVMRGLTY